MIWLFFIVVSVVLGSLASVFYKKSLSLSNFSEFWFAWLGILWWIMLSIIIFLTWKLDFSNVDYILLLLIFWILIVSIVSIYLNVVVMRTEKLSSLTPFLNVHKAIIIILSFLGIFLLLVIWYFVLWDKPSKKDVILSFVVTFLVWLWFMLNGSW